MKKIKYILIFILFYSVVCIILNNNKLFLTKGSDSLSFIHQIKFSIQLSTALFLNISIILINFFKKNKYRIYLWVFFTLSLSYFVLSTHTVVICYKNMVIKDMWCGCKIQEFRFQDSNLFSRKLIYKESMFFYSLKETDKNNLLIIKGVYPVKLNFQEIKSDLFFLNP